MKLRPQGNRRIRARQALLVCACIFSGALQLSGAARPRYGGTLRLGFYQTAETYDPTAATTLPERLLARTLYETLVAFDDREGDALEGDDQEGRAMGAASGLAARWHAELGGKRWVFQLRPGIRFHNGAPLNAASVRASLERAVARAQTASAAYLRRAQFVCASPSPRRLTCNLAKPIAALPKLLADPALAIAEADGAGTGPWKLASWSLGTRARLEAFDEYRQGRPFLDAIEARFGTDPRRQRVDFELKRVDVLVAVPTEARAPGQVRATPPSNLLLLGFSPATAFLRGGEQGGLAARQALLAVLDREALAGLLPPGRARAAKAFLPGWVSGYDFLLGFGAWRKPGTAQWLLQPAGALPRGPFRLIYDAADPVAELAASRLALDLRGMGMELRPQGLAGAGFRQARQAGRYDLFLESVSLRVEHPAAALADLLSRYSPERVPMELFQPARSIELQYRLERAALEDLRLIPLLHYRDQYSFQPGLEQVRLRESGMLDLANAWKR